MPNVFFKTNKQEAIGVLKATGSRDKDILYAAKQGQIKQASFPKFHGTLLMVAGGLICITIIGIPAGIFMLGFGWWLRNRGITSAKAIEEAYQEYTAGL